MVDEQKGHGQLGGCSMSWSDGKVCGVDLLCRDCAAKLIPYKTRWEEARLDTWPGTITHALLDSIERQYPLPGGE